jgi:hypothetical protein
VLVYWLTELFFSLTFGEPYYLAYESYGSEAQYLCVIIAIWSYFCIKTSRAENSISLIAFYSVYGFLMNAFYTITDYALLGETLLFSALAFWIMARPQISSDTINPDNITLAFYKGNNGTFVMRFFELFGLHAQSVCIIAGKDCLTLKKTKATFQIIDSKTILNKKRDYIFKDTGVKVTPEFTEKLNSYRNVAANRLYLRIRCIQAIKPLLKDIGPKWEVDGVLDEIPSHYLWSRG